MNQETAPPETVTRFAVLLRSKSGKAELLPVIHQSEDAAKTAGEFWQAQNPMNDTAEVVSFPVPLRGATIKTATDSLP